MTAGLRTLSLYLAAAAVYVAIGLYEVDFLLSWPVGVGYLVLTCWLVPAIVRRLLR